MKNIDDFKIAILGLGYVGLPLAVEFSRHYPLVGYDLDANKIAELRQFHDSTLELTSADLRDAGDLSFTDDVSDLRDASVYIVTVPTPVDSNKRPDLTCIEEATTSIAGLLSKGDTVIYESTVYPGVTEEVCMPILERVSGLTFNQDFFLGYSPERVNPGDKKRTLTKVIKITSGSNLDTAEFVDKLYSKIIEAGTHRASSIKVAEAAKVIENTQRDLNIALVNELSIIFNKMGIDTQEVLDAACTKWNFLDFRPGLVGGHCIGVDPYYLTFKAQELGYQPQVILAGRRINDSMGFSIADEIVKMMMQRKINLVNAKVLILGLTFKENCSDVRNTKVVDIVSGLDEYSVDVDIYDPWVNRAGTPVNEGLSMLSGLGQRQYQGVVLAVKHDEFISMGIGAIRELCVPNAPIYDLKSAFPKVDTDRRL
ncbi:MAG: UDP-N-acetyl-D-galactosamine dehydrogenase [Arenicella sp.]|jgi:UDP-N-acetyl-D-galactosamine dehydrogenase